VRHILIFVAGIFTVAKPALGEANGLCNSDEVMIASCELREKKGRALSFCSSQDKRTAVYRFGTVLNIELSNKFSMESPMSRWVAKWTYTTYLGFRINDHAYVLGVPQETYDAKAFVEITRNGLMIMNRDCLENSFGEMNLHNDAIQDLDDDLVRGEKFLFPPVGSIEGVGREP